MKTCNKCKQEKQLIQFSKNKHFKDGYEYWCKLCKSEYHAKKGYLHDRYKNNTQLAKDKQKEAHNSIQPGVYMIKNLITGKCYIGSSKIPYARRTQHFSIRKSSANNINVALQEDLVKQHKKGFVFGIVEYCKLEQLLEREHYYINLLNPEYNLK
jgi:hypothetical protein